MYSQNRIKILFIANSMKTGGAERALLTLLSHINLERFEVDLLLFNNTGAFLDYIPNGIKVFEVPKQYHLKTNNLLLGKLFNLAFKTYTCFWKIIRNIALILPGIRQNKNQKRWIFNKNTTPRLNYEYDYAIAFLEITPLYYLIDKVQARKRICFIHTDYEKAKLDVIFDRSYYSQVDKVVAVSSSCMKSFLNAFPEYAKKVEMIKNIVSLELCLRMSDEKIEDFNFPGVKILTIGRLSYEKGIDIAVNTLNILIKNGIKVKWFVIGDGAEKDNLISMVNHLEIDEHFIFLGEKANPYPYLKDCDIYVQPSRYEGWGLAVEEAILFNKIVVTTNFQTAYEQIDDGRTGFICINEPTVIAKTIEKIIKCKNLRDNIINNLINRNRDTKNNQKINQIIEKIIK